MAGALEGSRSRRGGHRGPQPRQDDVRARLVSTIREEQASYMYSREEELLVTSGFTEHGSHLQITIQGGHK